MTLKKLLNCCTTIAAPMVVCGVLSSHATAQVDYSRSLAADFAADYADTGSGPQPQNNPFGDWTFLPKDDGASTLVSVPGGLPASGQAGWGTDPAQ
ncbi:MAG: hypothetical protein IT424_07090 [Pirellulales bacterium]|nr:hypothetical protein [Pirellulales bacterium]